MSPLIVEAIEIFTALAKRMAEDGLDPKREAARIAESYASRERTEGVWKNEIDRKFPNTGE